MAAIFAPSLLDWLFGPGIGTNIGAAIVWIPIGAVLGVCWSRTKYWPLHTIHVHLEALRDRHDNLEASHELLHAKLDRIEGRLSNGDG